MKMQALGAAGPFYRYNAPVSLPLRNLDAQQLALDFAHISKNLRAKQRQCRVNQQVEDAQVGCHGFKQNANQRPRGECILLAEADCQDSNDHHQQVGHDAPQLQVRHHHRL